MVPSFPVHPIPKTIPNINIPSKTVYDFLAINGLSRYTSLFHLKRNESSSLFPVSHPKVSESQADETCETAHSKDDGAAGRGVPDKLAEQQAKRAYGNQDKATYFNEFPKCHVYQITISLFYPIFCRRKSHTPCISGYSRAVAKFA